MTTPWLSRRTVAAAAGSPTLRTTMAGGGGFLEGMWRRRREKSVSTSWQQPCRAFGIVYGVGVTVQWPGAEKALH